MFKIQEQPSTFQGYLHFGDVNELQGSLDG
jgi:hypothetical protein